MQIRLKENFLCVMVQDSYYSPSKIISEVIKHFAVKKCISKTIIQNANLSKRLLIPPFFQRTDLPVMMSKKIKHFFLQHL